MHELVYTKDLARTHLTCRLDRQFPENLHFGQANISVKNFQFWIFGGNNQTFSLQIIVKDKAEV